MSVIAHSAEAVDGEAKISLKISDLGQDGICLVAKLSEGVDLCGFRGVLLYDAEKLELVSVQTLCVVPRGASELSFLDSNGVVCFILEGDGNLFHGEVAEFAFKLKNSQAERSLGFEIIPLESYRLDGDGFVSLGLQGDALDASDFATNDNGILLEATLRDSGEGLVLMLEGRTETNCVAAGFEVSVLSAEDGSGESYTTACAMPGSGAGPCVFSCRIRLATKGLVCVAVCPVTYGRGGIGRGQREFLIFLDGVLIERTSAI